ncbi:MAG: substrate-binding domain-containing protein [Steroidobacteraceae bacterium]
MIHRRILLAGALLLSGQMATAATLTVLSTGAVEPGIRAAAEQFRKDTGHDIRITFQTAPEVKLRLEAREVWDLAVATPATILEQTESGVLVGGAVTLGRVGVGIAVRQGTRPPSIATVDDVKRAVLAADHVFVSRGSTGVYAEGLIKKLGLFEQIESRFFREDRGSEAMHRLATTAGKGLAFGALTEIASAREEGVVLVGPLPAELQNYTTYTIAQMRQAPTPDVAAAFLRYLQSPASETLFSAQGIAK